MMEDSTFRADCDCVRFLDDGDDSYGDGWLQRKSCAPPRQPCQVKKCAYVLRCFIDRQMV